MFLCYCRTICQICTYVLNKICSYLSSLLGQSFLSSILCVHKVFLVNICSIIIQMMCALTCICVSQILVKDLGFLCSVCCHRISTDCFFEKKPIALFPLTSLYNVIKFAYAWLNLFSFKSCFWSYRGRSLYVFWLS